MKRTEEEEAELLHLKTVRNAHTTDDIGGGHLGLPDLPVELDREQGVMFSSWEMTHEQTLMIAAGGTVRLGVWSIPTPPVGVRIQGPICEVHNCEEDWDEDDHDWECRMCAANVAEHTDPSD